MAKTVRLKLLCTRALLTLLLIFGVVSTGYPNGEEPPGSKVPERLSGPAAVGTMMITQGNGAFVNITFNGRCGAEDVTLSAPMYPSKFGTDGPSSFSDFRPEDLVDQRLKDGTTQLTAAGVQCYARAGVSGDLIVNTVTRFTNFGTSATAEVVIMAVVGT